MKTLKAIGQFLLNYVWQFPQGLIGFILCKIQKAKKETIEHEGKTYEYWSYEKKGFLSGASLVRIVLPKISCVINTIKHEFGHCIQSKILGPLYLIVIGLPSACGNLWDRWFHKKWTYEKRIDWYYRKLPWERWADLLGKVERT